MNSPRLRRLAFAAAAVAIATAASLAAPAASEKQTAQATQWKMYIGSNESYCEGCCPQGYLCCNVNAVCRVAIAPPA